MKEKIYVYLLLCDNKTIFVKDKNLESFIFEYKDNYFNLPGKIKSLGNFEITYSNPSSEDDDIDKVIRVAYNWMISSVFTPKYKTKPKLTDKELVKAWVSTIPEKGIDTGEPSRVQHNHVINPPV